MKPYFIYISIIMLLMISCGPTSQNNIKPKAQLTLVMPSTIAPQTIIDTLKVGNIIEGETIKTYFYLKNNNSTPLVIASTVTGCGCTNLEYNKTPIMPGDSTLFTLIFDSKDRFGTQLKDIDIIDAENQIAKIIMLGTVVDNN